MTGEPSQQTPEHPRLLSVSNHITAIEPVSDLPKIWLEEAARAARTEHGVEKGRLNALTKADHDMVLVSTATLEELNQFRKTLVRLADDLESSNPEKSKFYRRLADATELDDEYERREPGVKLA